VKKITHFLPLIINRKHIEKGHIFLMERLKILNKINYSGNIPQWYKKNAFDGIINKNSILQYTDMLIEMMNNIVVNLVTNKKVNPKEGVKLLLCEKALNGYTSFHHILLYLIQCNKNVVLFANKNVESFKNGKCNKNYCKDLGKLLIYLLISKYNWGYIAKEFILELFTRNVKWYTKSAPLLNNIDFVGNRLGLTYKYTGISRKLVLFQIWFINNVGLLRYKNYNDKLGRTSVNMRIRLQKETKKIMILSTWNSFFKRINVAISINPNKINKELHYLLQWSVLNSHKNGYHQLYNININKIKMKSPKIMYYNPSLPGSVNTFDDIKSDDDQGFSFSISCCFIFN